MSTKEFKATHKRLVAAGFRTTAGQPKGTYHMPGYPLPQLKVETPVETQEDLIELVFWFGHVEGEKRMRKRLCEAMGF